ncbi:MAG: hypothetical protein R6V07_01000, partial [Armatimonadota bacterium]
PLRGVLRHEGDSFPASPPFFVRTANGGRARKLRRALNDSAWRLTLALQTAQREGRPSLTAFAFAKPHG